jgi:hypothetical protein
MATPRIYRITFMSQGRIYELYAKSVGSAEMFGFVEVSNLLWSQKSSVVIDPSEDSLKHEFDGVKRFYVPMHSVIRIDEVDHEGTSKIVTATGAGGTVSPFPVFIPPGGDKKH